MVFRNPFRKFAVKHNRCRSRSASTSNDAFESDSPMRSFVRKCRLRTGEDALIFERSGMRWG